MRTKKVQMERSMNSKRKNGTTQVRFIFCSRIVEVYEQDSKSLKKYNLGCYIFIRSKELYEILMFFLFH